MKRYSPNFLLFILSIAFAALAVSAGAHQGATGVVKQRMEAMKNISRNQKKVVAMFRSKAPFSAVKIEEAAREIERHAAQIPELFPEGSLRDVSEASPKIWQDWDDFVALSGELAKRAEALRIKAAEADSTEDIRAEFLALGQSCKSCHSGFRVKK